jgi:hypothetical protein
LEYDDDDEEFVRFVDPVKDFLYVEALGSSGSGVAARNPADSHSFVKAPISTLKSTSTMEPKAG